MRIAKLFRSFVHVIGEYPIFFLLFLATITIRRNADGVFDTSVNQHVAHFDRQKSLKTSTDFCWIRIWTLSGHLDDGTCLNLSNFMDFGFDFWTFLFLFTSLFSFATALPDETMKNICLQKNIVKLDKIKTFFHSENLLCSKTFLNFHKIDKKCYSVSS